MLDTMKRPDRGETRYGAKGAASQTRKPHPLNNTNKINFEAINEAAVRSLPFLLDESGRPISLPAGAA